MSNALDGKGYHLITAADGEQALEAVMRQRPKLVLLDVVLPKKNGFQICRQIKSSPETNEIKVILVTMKGQDADKYWGMKQGADDYITKPYLDADLLARVEKLLD